MGASYKRRPSARGEGRSSAAGWVLSQRTGEALFSEKREEEREKKKVFYVESPPWERKGEKMKFLIFILFLFVEERSIRLHLQSFYFL